MDCSPPGSLSMAFSRQEYWSGLPFPSPRGQESKLSFRHSESGAVKGKETTRNVQACAVFRLSCLLSGKEREKLLPLFLLLTATLSAHSHLSFSSPSASNPNKGSCLQRRPRRPGGGEAGSPAIRRGGCRTQAESASSPGQTAKGPTF